VRSTLQPGLDAGLEYLVPPERTVPRLLPSRRSSLSCRPLATGYLVGIVEWTCLRALDGYLDAGEQTLGVHVDLSHDAPTPPDCTITVEVEVTAVDRRQVTFTVHAFDEAATVCRGTHKRTVIDTVRFQDRLRQRAATISGDPA